MNYLERSSKMIKESNKEVIDDIEITYYYENAYNILYNIAEDLTDDPDIVERTQLKLSSFLWNYKEDLKQVSAKTRRKI
jgi:hypothetical protein